MVVKTIVIAGYCSRARDSITSE